MAYSEILKNAHLFKDFTPAELDTIQTFCQSESFNNGDYIFMQDDKPTALYVIKFGSVKVSQKVHGGDSIEVGKLGTGAHFGEMSFIDGLGHAATTMALEHTEIIKIDYASLQNFLLEHPIVAMKFYRSLAHFLCGRLRVTTMDLGFARERNSAHPKL